MISSLLTTVAVVLTVAAAAVNVALATIADEVAVAIDNDAVPTVDAAETAMDCITAALLWKMNFKQQYNISVPLYKDEHDIRAVEIKK